MRCVCTCILCHCPYRPSRNAVRYCFIILCLHTGCCKRLSHECYCILVIWEKLLSIQLHHWDPRGAIPTPVAKLLSKPTRRGFGKQGFGYLSVFYLCLQIAPLKHFYVHATVHVLAIDAYFALLVPCWHWGLHFCISIVPEEHSLKIETWTVLSPLNGKAKNSIASLFGIDSRLPQPRSSASSSNQIIKFLQGMVQLFRTCFIFWDCSGRK